jgi:hypothetical protein
MSLYNIAVLDDESIKDLFEAAFKARLADRANNDMDIEEDNFEAEVERLGQTGDIRIKVTMFGLAGGTTRRQFHDKDTGKIIKGGKSLAVTVGNKGESRFTFDGSSELNTNDYVVYYKMEK